MTKHQLLKKLHECIEIAEPASGKIGDPDVGHSEADDAVMTFLRSIGHGDVVDVFDKIRKWYS